MYNRYIPQPDGSYQCNRMPGRNPGPPPRPQRPPSPPPEKPCDPEPQRPAQHNRQPPCRREQSAGSFLQNLLPQSFDTGDLIVILLLLLLAGDCEEDRSTALLTLVLYLFM